MKLYIFVWTGTTSSEPLIHCVNWYSICVNQNSACEPLFHHVGHHSIVCPRIHRMRWYSFVRTAIPSCETLLYRMNRCASGCTAFVRTAIVLCESVSCASYIARKCNQSSGQLYGYANRYFQCMNHTSPRNPLLHHRYSIVQIHNPSCKSLAGRVRF